MRLITQLISALVLALFLPLQATALEVVDNEVNDSFSFAKKLLQEKVYVDYRVTFYCGFEYDEDKRIDLPSGFRTPKHKKRAYRIEWEHVVPAENLGRAFPEWRRRT